MSKNILLGSILNYGVDDIRPWVVSAIRNIPNAEIYMFAHNVTNETIDFLQENGINVIIIEDWSPDHNICVQRFKYYYQLLMKVAQPVDVVLATDVKDVVFQSDPFFYIRDGFERTQYTRSIFLTSESITYENEDWGKSNLYLSFGNDMLQRLQYNEIHNAGVIGGMAHDFASLCEMVYFYSISCGNEFVYGGGGPDQAALNVIINYPFISEKCVSSSTFACQCGTVNNKQYESKITSLPGIMNDEGLVHSAIGKYAYFPVVHQYDRVPGWSEKIREKWGK